MSERMRFLRWAVLLIILAGAFWLRGHDPLYNTAFMDETFHVRYGRMFLANHFEYPFDMPLHWVFSWYLWGIFAVIAERIAGIAGLREMSAFAGTVAVLAVYGSTRRLYSAETGLAAAAIFALLSPAVFSSRIATYDSGAVVFLALGLWVYVRAWQEMKNHLWLWAAVLFFAAFLCKYIMALYFPFLVLAALRKGRRPLLAFSLPLAIFCAGYAWYYRSDLIFLASFYSQFNKRNVMSGSQLWDIYVVQRLDLWVLGLLSLAAWPWTVPPGREAEIRRERWIFALMWTGAAAMLVFQGMSRLADMRFFKHATYSLLFLTPLAAQGILRLARLAGKTLYPIAGAVAVVLVAVSLGWAGNSWNTGVHIFWPNVEPIRAYFEGRLTQQDRLLIDDQGARYYLEPVVPGQNIIEAYYFRYHEMEGPPAYAAAVADGYFDYVALDGSGNEEEVLKMRDAIRPVLAGRYVLRMTMPEPALQRRIEIYERVNPPATTAASNVAAGASPNLSPRVEILFPAAGAAVRTSGIETKLEGRVEGAPAGAYLLAELFTNRWYSQGGRIIPGAAGAFTQPLYLGGQGAQQCNHVVRVRLYDAGGNWLATATQFGIIRANADGSSPSCP